MELINLKSNIDINSSGNNVDAIGQGIVKLPGTSDHSQLQNLDYEHSGHTGFQSEIEDLTEIRNGAEAGATAVQDDSYVHTDNNFTDEEKEKIANLKDLYLIPIEVMDLDETSSEEDILDAFQGEEKLFEFKDIVKDAKQILAYGLKLEEATYIIPAVTLYSPYGDDGFVVQVRCFFEDEYSIVGIFKDNSGYSAQKTIEEFTTQDDLDDYLSKYNIEEYTPLSNYNPATKKYVDDNILNYTFNQEHNIRQINNDVQVFTDNGDAINDNEMFLKNIHTTGTWVFVKDNFENIVGYSNSSNIILISKNGGLDFETITMPTIIKSGCYDLANKTYKLLGVQKVFESSDLVNWTPYNTDSTDWDYIGVKVKFTGTTFLSSSTNRRWKECSTSSYTGSYRTYTKTPKSIARINNTSIMMIVNTDNTQTYTASIDTPNLPVQLNANINKIINLNDIVFALCNNSNKLYEYVMSSITVTNNDYWQEYTLPITCTVEDVTYNSLDGYYYIVNDNNNYFKTKDFETFETVNKNTIRGKYCIRTKEGLIISPNNSNQLLIVPAREKLENRLQQLKMGLDKTRWVGDGLELVGEQIKVKGSYNIQVTSGGIYVSDSLDLFNFSQDIRTLMRTRLADVLDYPIEGTQEYLDEWIWTEEILWEKLFDGAVQAIQVRWSVGGTFYEPYGYYEEYTVEKYERGCFYIDQDDTNLKYMKIGVEPPIE